MESSMEVPQNLTISMPSHPVLPLPGIYPKEYKPEYNRAFGTFMFIAALFTIAKL
jgi:hypothetical protein